MMQSPEYAEEAGTVWYLTSEPDNDIGSATPRSVGSFNPEREARDAPPEAHGFLYTAFTQIIAEDGQNLTALRDDPFYRSGVFLIADRLELLDRKEMLHLGPKEQARLMVYLQLEFVLHLRPQIIRIRRSGEITVFFREPARSEVLLDVG